MYKVEHTSLDQARRGFAHGHPNIRRGGGVGPRWVRLSLDSEQCGLTAVSYIADLTSFEVVGIVLELRASQFPHAADLTSPRGCGHRSGAPVA